MQSVKPTSCPYQSGRALDLGQQSFLHSCPLPLEVSAPTHQGLHQSQIKPYLLMCDECISVCSVCLFTVCWVDSFYSLYYDDKLHFVQFSFSIQNVSVLVWVWTGGETSQGLVCLNATLDKQTTVRSLNRIPGAELVSFSRSHTAETHTSTTHLSTCRHNKHAAVLPWRGNFHHVTSLHPHTHLKPFLFFD